MNIDDLHSLSDRTQVGESSESLALSPLEMDVARYVGLMNEFDISEAQKIELLETLWSIMSIFVKLGVSIDICGQFFEGSENGTAKSREDIE